MQPAFDIYSIDTREQFDALVEAEKGYPDGIVTLDSETDNKSEKLAKLHGIGLCFSPTEAFYIPIRNNRREMVWSDSDLAVISSWCREVATRRGWLGHNAIYDTLVLENNFGWDIAPYLYSDTILLKHLCDEERPFGLKEVGVKYLGPWADKAQTELYASIERNGGSTTKDNLEMYKADQDILAEYCGFDVILTRMLFDLFEPRIHAEGLDKLFYEDEVMPLYREVTIDMKRKGFHVDLPHFEKLKADIAGEIEELESSIVDDIAGLTSEFEWSLLDKDYPVKKTGSFPKRLAAYLGVTLPEKDGKTTLAKKELEKKRAEGLGDERSSDFFGWLLEDQEFDSLTLFLVQEQWCLEDTERKHIFNLKSNDHLGWLLFTKLGLTPDDHTETGKPQIDDDYLESIKSDYGWVAKLVDYKKLNKLSSTYIDGILERQIDGVIYASMLMFGTTSGRYSCTNPNLQNLPRVKEEDSDISPLVLKFVNAIRAGFIAPPGYSIVDADQSALEPRSFAHVSNDDNLRNIFIRGEDMYASIAKRMFGLHECSVFKKDSNFLGKLYPEKRQTVKTFALAVAYGAEAPRIAGLLGISIPEAQQLIDDYLESYPGLSAYIRKCHFDAKTKGYVATMFGRVRHIPYVKDIYERYGDKLLDYRWARKNDLLEVRRKYKTGLNNSTNMPIQGLAAHIMNRSGILIARDFKEQGVDAYIALQIHDQYVCVARNCDIDKTKAIMKNRMENTVVISVPLIAEPSVGANMAESH